MLDPKKRLNMAGIMEHPWFTDGNVPSSAEVM